MQFTNEIIPFAFGDSLVRTTIDEEGNPWWVAKDVCTVLGIENNRDAVSSLDDDERSDVGITDISSNGVAQERRYSVVNEPGLYSLVFRSRKPEAREFKRWVTHEVLPALRKTGVYVHPRRAAEPPEPLALDFESLPEDVRRLKPRTRERCMHLALQSARLSGLNSQPEQLGLFVEFCRVLGQPAENTWQGHKYIRQYIDSQLVPCPGGRLQADRAYGHFLRWWRANFPGGHPPSQFNFSGVLGSVYRKLKSNRWFYCDVDFRPEN